MQKKMPNNMTKSLIVNKMQFLKRTMFGIKIYCKDTATIVSVFLKQPFEYIFLPTKSRSFFKVFIFI